MDQDLRWRGGAWQPPMAVFSFAMERIALCRNEANSFRALACLYFPPADLNHWVLGDTFLQPLMQHISVQWGVQIHPFANRCFPKAFSTFSPSGSMGQTTGRTFALGHLWGIIFVAPQGPAMATVVASCKAALEKCKKGASMVVCCVARESRLFGFDPFKGINVTIPAQTLFQMLQNFRSEKSQILPLRKMQFFVLHSSAVLEAARNVLHTKLAKFLAQFLAPQEAGAAEERLDAAGSQTLHGGTHPPGTPVTTGSFREEEAAPRDGGGFE